MDVYLVPTFHWDREWYRTFQAFRARLVDSMDHVLDLLEADDGYTFLLDGQSIVLEDYVAIRPGRRTELERAIRDRRVEIGPWYVQPDSLLPSGETHIRNLLEGRRAGEEFGPVSRVAYTPDSFGHPAQFPQIFSGFGIRHFVYWRGNGSEIAELPAEYRWESPDGTSIVACHLWLSYLNAAGIPRDVEQAVARLRRTVDDLSARAKNDRVLLMAGNDHQPPDPHTREVCSALAEATGSNVRRALLSDFVDGLDPDGPTFSGELLGARTANLLPGVWSTRTYLKLLNRRCETALDGWAEPWAALGSVFGCADERPALRIVWRELLQNQAHDSICGCSQDAVHEQMLGRYATATELARETTSRVCERMAGLDVTRRVPWSDEVQVAVFNPSPHERTDVVRFPLQGYPPFDQSQRHFIHPLVWSNMRAKGFEVDGKPARLRPVDTHDRVRIINDQDDYDVEFVADEVPAFGWKRFTLRPADEAHPDTTDYADTISAGDISVTAAPNGLTVRFADKTFTSVCALDDTGDRGDTYDFDPVETEPRVRTAVGPRRSHVAGIEEIDLTYVVDVPRLAVDRQRATDETDPCTVAITARVVRGMQRVDLSVKVDNRARDHRLRLLFPTGAHTDAFSAATTFGIADRTTTPADASEWIHPAPSTFPHLGFVHANGLTVAAPGLNEAEVTQDGTIAITLLRAVGWLSRMDLTTRNMHAGPALPTPGAQCLRTFDAALSLFGDLDPRAIRDAELGLHASPAGALPLLEPGTPMLTLEPRDLVLSSLKPAEREPGIVLRVLNPTSQDVRGDVRVAFDVREVRPVRLDEEASGEEASLYGRRISLDVPAMRLRTILIVPA